MYIHFSGTSLKRYNTERFYAQDEDFDYTKKCIDKETVMDFKGRERTFLRNLGSQF